MIVIDVIGHKYWPSEHHEIYNDQTADILTAKSSIPCRSKEVFFSPSDSMSLGQDLDSSYVYTKIYIYIYIHIYIYIYYG